MRSEARAYTRSEPSQTRCRTRQELLFANGVGTRAFYFFFACVFSRANRTKRSSGSIGAEWRVTGVRTAIRSRAFAAFLPRVNCMIFNYNIGASRAMHRKPLRSLISHEINILPCRRPQTDSMRRVHFVNGPSYYLSVTYSGSHLYIYRLLLRRWC